MLSPLMIVSLDQGTLYGRRPTVEELEAGMIEDLGFVPGTIVLTPAPNIGRPDWTARLREWLAVRAGRRTQPNF